MLNVVFVVYLLDVFVLWFIASRMKLFIQLILESIGVCLSFIRRYPFMLTMYVN